MLDVQALRSIKWENPASEKLAGWIIDLVSDEQPNEPHAGLKLQQYLGYHDAALNVYESYKDRLSTDDFIVATPFFVQLLDEPKAPKSLVFVLLGILASYKRYSDELEAEHQIRANAIYQMLLTHFSAYQPYLDEKDADTRIYASYLLDKFSEKSSVVVEELLNRLENQQNYDWNGEQAFVRTCAAEIIFGKVRDNPIIHQQFSQRFIKVLRQWIDNYFETISNKAKAAYILISLLGNSIEDSTVKILCNVLKLPSFHHLDISPENCADAFLGLGVQRATDLLLEIFDDQTYYGFILEVATWLLAIHFGGCNHNDFHLLDASLPDSPKIIIQPHRNIQKYETPLTDYQKTVIQHLLAKDEIWQFENNLFEVFSLPNTKAELKALITSQ